MPIEAGGESFLTPADVGAGGGLLQGLDPDYQLKQQAVRQATAFSGGMPTTDGTPNGPIDWNAATRKLLSLGDYNGAASMMQLGIRQNVLGSGGVNLDDPMGRGAAGGAPVASAAPAVSTKGIDPQVVDYTKQAFASRGVNPGYGLAVLAGEGGRGFDPSGNANPGDQGTSFGPFQLHYGGQVSGPNSVAGLGDDFTKATGLDARNPSTWKQQIDFVADHVANNGWGAFHAAKTLGIGNWAGIGNGQPSGSSTVVSGASAVPASSSSTPAANPYRVASNGSVAAPTGQQPVQGDPTTASTPSPSTVTLADFAKRQRPDDPTLGQRLGDALGVDPSEPVDFSDPRVRSAILPVMRAPVPTVAATGTGIPAAPSDTVPSGQHPFAPTPRGPAAPPAVGGQSFTPGAVAGPNGVQLVGGGQPGRGAMPVAGDASPPPVLPGQGQSQNGPDFPGLPAGYQGPGGSYRYLNDLNSAAVRYDAAGVQNPALTTKIQQVTAEIKEREAFQNNLALAQARANDRYNAANSPQAIAAAGARAAAEASERAKSQLVPSVQPDGSVTQIPASQALDSAANGQPIVSAQPGYVTEGQGNLLTKLNNGSAAYDERQVASQRLDALSNLLETVQTGANTTAWNNAVAQVKSLGIPVPTSLTSNPAAVQEFTKNSYANVLSSMKEQGNKQYAAEVQSAVNSNPNPDLQPEANAAMIAQMQGVKRWTDQNFRDYSQWYHANKGAADDADFQTGWADQHPLGAYVSAAAKDIAPAGAMIPGDPAQLVDGQAYRIRGAKVRWNAASGGFVPSTGPTSVSLPGNAADGGARAGSRSYTPAASSIDALAQARAAVARGADPNAVRARLQQNGIDPGQL